MCEGLMDEGAAGPTLCLHPVTRHDRKASLSVTARQPATRGHPPIPTVQCRQG